MKPRPTMLIASIVAVLAACSSAPVRSPPALQAAVTAATGPGAMLPSPGAAYLAQPWFAEALTAGRAVQATLANHPDVRAELARLDAAHAERIQAGLLQNPMLSAMGLRAGGGGRWELELGWMQSLFDLFTRSRRIALADAVQARTEAEVLAALLDRVRTARASYFRALAAQQRVALLQELLRLAVRQQSLLETQARSGVVAAAGVLQQRADVAQRGQALREAEAAQVQAFASLASALGLSTAAWLRLPAGFAVPEFGDLDLARLQQLALAHRPELPAAQAAVDQAQAERSLQAGAIRNAMASAGPAVMREDSGMTSRGVGLQLSLPIFDSGQAREALAGAKVQEARFRQETRRRQVPLEVEQAVLTVLANQVAVRQAGQQAQQQARLAELAARRHRDGGSDLRALLAAQHAVVEARLQELAAGEHLATAITDLERAAATPMPETR